MTFARCQSRADETCSQRRDDRLTYISLGLVATTPSTCVLCSPDSGSRRRYPVRYQWHQMSTHGAAQTPWAQGDLSDRGMATSINLEHLKWHQLVCNPPHDTGQAVRAARGFRMLCVPRVKSCSMPIWQAFAVRQCLEFASVHCMIWSDERFQSPNYTLPIRLEPSGCSSFLELPIYFCRHSSMQRALTGVAKVETRRSTFTLT